MASPLPSCPAPPQLLVNAAANELHNDKQLCIQLAREHGLLEAYAAALKVGFMLHGAGQRGAAVSSVQRPSGSAPRRQAAPVCNTLDPARPGKCFIVLLARQTFPEQL